MDPERKKMTPEERRQDTLRKRQQQAQEQRQHFISRWDSMSVDEAHAFLKKFDAQQKLKELEQQVDEQKKRIKQKEAAKSSVAPLLRKRGLV